MSVDIDFISGLMFGIELIDDELWGTGLIIDLGIFRITIDFSS